MQREPFIKIRKIKKYFANKKNVVKAVEDFSLDIYPGEIVGVVGESGSGKTTLGHTILRLCKANSGKVIYKDKNLFQLPLKEMKRFRRDLQIIFQDPYASLNPRMTVFDIVREGLDIHNLFSKEEKKERVKDILKTVGLKEEQMSRYPHEFSGGQRQRIGIARALVVKPKFIICDEPISALDVSIQAQIINLLKTLQKDMELTYLIIAHDLCMIKYISDRVAVMYLGRLVELASSEELYNNPLNPYTQLLLSSIPRADPKINLSKKRSLLKGEGINSPDTSKGCPFYVRCPYKKDVCFKVFPDWMEAKTGHFVACHLHS